MGLPNNGHQGLVVEAALPSRPDYISNDLLAPVICYVTTLHHQAEDAAFVAALEEEARAAAADATRLELCRMPALPINTISSVSHGKSREKPFDLSYPLSTLLVCCLQKFVLSQQLNPLSLYAIASSILRY